MPDFVVLWDGTPTAPMGEALLPPRDSRRLLLGKLVPGGGGIDEETKL